MARNIYPGYCYCCGKYVEPGYGHFERVKHFVPGLPKWRIKCVQCASGRILTDKDPGVIRAKKGITSRKHERSKSD